MLWNLSSCSTLLRYRTRNVGFWCDYCTIKENLDFDKCNEAENRFSRSCMFLSMSVWVENMFISYLLRLWIESIIWKTRMGISSSINNQETTFSKWVSQFAMYSSCCWHLFNLHWQCFVEFSLVYSSFLTN